MISRLGQEITVDHSYEEIRNVALDLLAGRESGKYALNQYIHFHINVASVFERRIGQASANDPSLSRADKDIFLEVFWGLFREGIITLGQNDSQPSFPHFRVSEFGRKLLEGGDAYFFHDVSSFEGAINSEIPDINPVTMLYLKEAMQAFKSNCILSATVILGVATEHTFQLLMETINQSKQWAPTFANVEKERGILRKVNKFKGILDQHIGGLSPEIKEDLETHFSGILSIIRNFRNESGHPTGKIISREQAYVLLQLFIPYCKKMYQLKGHFS